MNARRRQTVRRAPASVYAGRQFLGRVEPASAGYIARNADGRRLGLFGSFAEAVKALGAPATIDAERGR